MLELYTASIKFFALKMIRPTNFMYMYEVGHELVSSWFMQDQRFYASENLTSQAILDKKFDL